MPLLSDPEMMAAIRRVLTRHQPRLDTPRCQRCGGIWHPRSPRSPAGCAARRLALGSLATLAARAAAKGV